LYAQYDHCTLVTMQTGYTNWSFYSVPSGNFWDSTFRKRRPLPFTSFPNHHNDPIICCCNQCSWKVSLYKLRLKWSINQSPIPSNCIQELSSPKFYKYFFSLRMCYMSSPSFPAKKKASRCSSEYILNFPYSAYWFPFGDFTVKFHCLWSRLFRAAEIRENYASKVMFPGQRYKTLN
jgi:hypothetical protein